MVHHVQLCLGQVSTKAVRFYGVVAERGWVGYPGRELWELQAAGGSEKESKGRTHSFFGTG